jgi:DNA repair protein RadC
MITRQTEFEFQGKETRKARGPRIKHIPVYHVELVRDRLIKIDPNTAIKSVGNAVEILRDELMQADREKLICLMLNARHVLVGLEIVSVGTLTASLAHPREIFKGAILKNAAGIILAHNHPSGDPAPSDEDTRLTKRIAQAGSVMGIDLLDHIILADGGSYSFKTSGQLP